MTRSIPGRLRPAGLTAGATLTVLSASAVAFAATPASPAKPTHLAVGAHHVRLGAQLTVGGSVAPGADGRVIQIQFQPARGGAWRVIGRVRASRSGAFRTAVKIPQNGLVRAEQATAQSNSSADAPTHARNRSVSANDTAAQDALPPASEPIRVTVGSVLQVRPRDYVLLAGQRVVLQGRLLPAAAGRPVQLQSLRSGRWENVARARTGPRGGFTLRYTPAQPGGSGLRVRFVGDRITTRASHGAGRVTAFREAVASWYDDTGATACGYHAGYAVANLSLPCGTKVTFHYGGRTVTAVVDDRGPYIGGREYDLNQNTAAALGFDGVGTVWTTR